MSATRRPRLPASIAHIRPAAPAPRINASNFWITRSHIEGAEPRYLLVLKKLFLHVVFHQSSDLCTGHFVTIGRELAIRGAANVDDLFVWHRGQQCSVEFLFQHGQAPLEILQSSCRF